jgi:hypothetical protein
MTATGVSQLRCRLDEHPETKGSQVLTVKLDWTKGFGELQIGEVKSASIQRTRKGSRI